MGFPPVVKFAQRQFCAYRPLLYRRVPIALSSSSARVCPSLEGSRYAYAARVRLRLVAPSPLQPLMCPPCVLPIALIGSRRRTLYPNVRVDVPEAQPF